VPEAGFEPARPYGQKGLSLQRLPDYATRARRKQGSGNADTRGSRHRPETCLGDHPSSGQVRVAVTAGAYR
jgi:hypothetical protein